MSFRSFLHEGAKRWGFIDSMLILIATACFVILVVKFAPRIIIIRKEWYISIFILASIKPIYVFLKNKPS